MSPRPHIPAPHPTPTQSRAQVPKHAVITALGGKPTPDLPAFAAALRSLAPGARAPLEYFTFGDRNRRKHTLLFRDSLQWCVRAWFFRGGGAL